MEPRDGFEIDRRIFADRRVRTAAGLHTDDSFAGQGIMAHEKLRVLLGVNIIGYHGDVEFIAQRAAQRQGERGLARAHRAADADAEGLPVVHNFLGTKQARVLGFMPAGKDRQGRRETAELVVGDRRCPHGNSG